jgi:TonB family protein
MKNFARLLTLAMIALLSASPIAAQTAPTPPIPPSPYGSDTHGVYSAASGCWVWSAKREPKPQMDYFVVDIPCDGKMLQGPALLRWNTGPYTGQTWDGQFADGRFTGVATRKYNDALYEAHYRQGLLHGRTLYTFNRGGTLERNYLDDVQDGLELSIDPDGSRNEHHYAMGKPIGNAVQTYPDGSRSECPEPNSCREAPGGTLFSPGGARLPGSFLAPKADPANPPPAYPPVSIRMNESGRVLIKVQILKDGTPHNPRVLRTSGWQRLDESALAAVSSWVFHPATLDSQPIDSYLSFSLSFALNESR